MKYSKQRELIRDYVKSVKTHPTAEIVYQELRKEKEDISLGTVYRNLDQLSQAGELLRIKLANTKDRFDGDVSHHYHAICTECGSIEDIFCDYLTEVDHKIASYTDSTIVSHEMIFHTVCKNCKKLKEEL